jgi:hypothetical protein
MIDSALFAINPAVSPALIYEMSERQKIERVQLVRKCGQIGEGHIGESQMVEDLFPEWTIRLSRPGVPILSCRSR